MKMKDGDLIEIEVKKTEESNYQVIFTQNENKNFSTMISSGTPVYLLGALRQVNNSLEILTAKYL